MNRRAFVKSVFSHGLALTAGAAAASKVLAAPTYRWTKLESTGLSPRDSAATYVFLDKVWIFDGWLPYLNHTDDILCSSDGVHWEVVVQDHPFEKFTPAGPFGGELWVVGGSVWRSRDGINFKAVEAKNPPPVCYHAHIHTMNGKMVIVDPMSQVCFYSENGIEWNSVEIPISLRWGAADALFNGRLYVVAGAYKEPNEPVEDGYPDRTSTSEVWSTSNPEDPTSWVRHYPAPWEPRMWPGLAVFDGKLFMSGGYNSLLSGSDVLNFNDLWTMDATGEWSEVEMIDPPVGRHAPTLYAFRGHLFMACGNTNIEPNITSEVYRLDRNSIFNIFS